VIDEDDKSGNRTIGREPFATRPPSYRCDYKCEGTIRATQTYKRVVGFRYVKKGCSPTEQRMGSPLGTKRCDGGEHPFLTWL